MRCMSVQTTLDSKIHIFELNVRMVIFTQLDVSKTSKVSVINFKL